MERTMIFFWVLLTTLGIAKSPAAVSAVPVDGDSPQGVILTAPHGIRNSSGASELGDGTAAQEVGTYASLLADIDFLIRKQSSGCGGKIVVTNTSAAHIKSPTGQDGETYPDRSSCFWLVTAPEGSYLKFTQDLLSVFDIPETCGSDKLAIDDTEFCKDNPLSAFVVSSNRAIVTFKSDYSIGGRGFSIKIETEVPGSPTVWPYLDYFRNDASNLTGFDRLLRKLKSECGASITVTSSSPGLLSSPKRGGYNPEDYPDYANCIWVVKNADGGRLKLTQDPSSPFDIVETCANDKLVINGTEYCKENPFTDATISSSTTVVTFKTDGSVSGRGFSIKIEAVPEASNNATLGTPAHDILPHRSNETRSRTAAAPDLADVELVGKHLSTACGGRVNVTATAAGYIKYPLEEDGEYPPNAVCVWLAEAPVGMHLKFTQEPSSAFDIPELCHRDKLDIAGMEYCSDKPLNNLTIPFSQTIAIFRSDYSLGGKGFNIKVEAVE